MGDDEKQRGAAWAAHTSSDFGCSALVSWRMTGK